MARKKLFTVVLTEKQEKGRSLIRKNFGYDCFEVHENTFVVAHKGLSLDVAIASGIVEDKEGVVLGEVSGVVFELNGSYSGYAHQPMWEWLDERTPGTCQRHVGRKGPVADRPSEAGNLAPM